MLRVTRYAVFLVVLFCSYAVHAQESKSETKRLTDVRVGLVHAALQLTPEQENENRTVVHNAWKTAFESRRQDRLDAGLTDRVYGYDPDDNHKVTIVVAVSDTAKANAFWNSAKLKEDMAKGGVVGKPERFLFRVTKRY